MKTGIELIAQERAEQIVKHGRTVEKDIDKNRNQQLSIAAAKLISYEMDIPDFFEPKDWNGILWEHMISKPYKERLIIAGALIAAEIDRLRISENTK